LSNKKCFGLNNNPSWQETSTWLVLMRVMVGYALIAAQMKNILTWYNLRNIKAKVFCLLFA
jgi:hypothetical protein